MYPEVCAWLHDLLDAGFPRATVEVADTSRVILANYLEQRGLAALFPDCQTYEINVDVTGVVKAKKPHLAFVECKLTPLTLRDMSQLLGYSKVAVPV